MNAHKKNLPIFLILIIAFMLSLSYASVPLYRLFCQVTGFGGTTQKAITESDTIIDRELTVRLDSNIASDLDWEFKPQKNTHKIKVGENKIVYYKAKNISSETLSGTATYNVTPNKAGEYFNKVECFCFIEQQLKPGEEVMMPVVFFIDPEIINNKNLDDVKNITLSYSFFPVKK